jgi:hypothetical protein
MRAPCRSTRSRPAPADGAIGGVEPQLVALAGGGVIGGLVLLVRGFGGYRRAARITDTAPSRIESAAVGEVLVTGTVEPAELTLISPLQSATCVFYSSRIDEGDGETSATSFRQERAVGFRVRDETGDLRVFPRGARFDVPTRLDERTGTFGDEPAGLRLRSGSGYGPGLGREAQIAALLTVRPSGSGLPEDGDRTGSWTGFASSALGPRRRSRHYVEARIEPGDVVTVIGRAMPFDQLGDPTSADMLDGEDALLGDPEIAADLAAARAAGTLLDPDDAWGNAAIPGFGIGRPVSKPELDEAASEPALAAPAEADSFERIFEIAPDALVLAASPEVPLVISLGSPSAAAGRHEREFVIGLLGAIVAIGSAMALAMMLGGQG